MLPFSPTLFVRPLTPDDAATAQNLMDRALATSIFSRPASAAEVSAQLFAAAPPGLYTVRWQQRGVFAAVRVGEIVGLVDAAIGLDSESNDLPDYEPLGLLRMLILPADGALTGDAVRGLLATAEGFWQQHGVGRVKAFHPSTGYPFWQAGIGLLPADWVEHVQLLTARDYRYTDRYYCFVRRLRDDLFEESAPQTGLSLAFRGTNLDRRYQLFFRRTELIGEARLVQCPIERDGRRLCVGHLVHWEVDLRWRNQNVGRWMLRRIVNDAAQQSLDELLVFVRMQQAAAINLLVQHGFIEQAYRGYALEQTLRD